MIYRMKHAIGTPDHVMADFDHMIAAGGTLLVYQGRFRHGVR